MKILKFPDPRLFQKCDQVTEFGAALVNQLEAMWTIMRNSGGMGLSANQVGLMKRMFVMEGPNFERYYMINPEIDSRSSTSANLIEGCLSAPGERLQLDRRADSVTVSFQNVIGETVTKSFSGIHAVCVQHEIDHLDGISFLQDKNLSRQQRRAISRKWGITND